MSPKVSVIIPAYNAEEYIDDLMASLQAQTLRDIEVILVDDGSADKTGEKMLPWTERDSRFHCIHQENQGAGPARNTGIAHAKGEYLICIDADDLYMPEMMELLYDGAKKFDADITICNYIRKDYWNGREDKLGTGKCVLDTLITAKDTDKGIWSVTLNPHNKLYKTEFVKSNHLEYEARNICNDVGFVLRAIILAGSIVCLPDSPMIIRTHLDNRSISSNRYKYLEESIRVYEDAFKWIKSHPVDDDVFAAMEQQMANTFAYQLSYGYKKEYFDELRVLLSELSYDKRDIKPLKDHCGRILKRWRKKLIKLYDSYYSGEKTEAAWNSVIGAQNRVLGMSMVMDIIEETGHE